VSLASASSNSPKSLSFGPVLQPPQLFMKIASTPLASRETSRCPLAGCFRVLPCTIGSFSCIASGLLRAIRRLLSLLRSCIGLISPL
jgi:hypothetical protein